MTSWHLLRYLFDSHCLLRRLTAWDRPSIPLARDIFKLTDHRPFHAGGSRWRKKRNRSDNPCWPSRSVVVNGRKSRSSVILAYRGKQWASRFHGPTERLRRSDPGALPPRPWSARAGARCGSRASRRTVSGSSTGCAIGPGTPTGSTDRCARTTPASRSRCTRWGGAGRLHQPGAATAREPERPLQGPHRSLGLPVHAPDRARPDDGFPDEALRWWDHRLRGKDARVTAEPAYRV